MRATVLLAGVVLAWGALTACTASSDGSDDGSDDGGGSRVSTAPPQVGACRVLQPQDIAASTNDSDPVDCKGNHTAETFFVGKFTGRAAKLEPGDAALGAEVYDHCRTAFKKFTGADDSLAMRTVLSWAWWGPSKDQWDQGARWYRCDVVGGTESSSSLLPLPRTTKGVLLGIPGDQWITCVDATSVAGAPRVPCDQKHTWRAVSTIVVGTAKEKYPGDRVVEVRSRDLCSDWVGAWMNYPVTEYQYAYTWFHRGEWDAGNRRSICWARTTG